MKGVLRGFDPFMNLVIDEAVEEGKNGEKNNIGMVVSTAQNTFEENRWDKISLLKYEMKAWSIAVSAHFNVKLFSYDETDKTKNRLLRK